MALQEGLRARTVIRWRAEAARPTKVKGKRRAGSSRPTKVKDLGGFGTRPYANVSAAFAGR